MLLTNVDVTIFIVHGSVHWHKISLVDPVGMDPADSAGFDEGECLGLQGWSGRYANQLSYHLARCVMALFRALQSVRDSTHFRGDIRHSRTVHRPLIG